MQRPEGLDYRYLIIKPFIFASLILALAVGGLFYSSYQLIKLQTSNEQLEHFRYEILRLHNAITRAETGHHGYLLTANLHFYEGYKRARADIDSIKATLLIPQIPEVGVHIGNLEQLITAKLNNIDHSIQVEMTSGAYAPHLNSSKIAMDITNKIDVEFKAIDRLLLARKGRYARDLSDGIRYTEVGACFFVLVIIGLFVAGYHKTIYLFEVAANSKLTADEMSYSAYHDALTGLPNRRFFEDYLQRQIMLARRSGHHFSLMYMDLDGFKHINDVMGHDAGDEALRYAANRFRDALRESDFIARFGGDEFIVLVHDYTIQAEIGGLASRVIRYVNQPFTIQGKHQLLGVSIGVSSYPIDGENSEALIKAADDAMYLAKNYGKNRVFFAHG